MSEEKTHAPIGGSTIKRILRCPGSVVLAAQCPTPPTSEAAEEGNVAHACLEAICKGELDRESALMFYDEAMVDHALDFQNIILGYLIEGGGDLHVENKVDLTDVFEVPPEWANGTADIIITRLFDTLFVFDYKYGVGEIIEVQEGKLFNEQLIFYALGAAHRFDYQFEKVEIGIYQPRGRHPEGAWRTATLTMDELLEHRDLWKKHVQNVAIKKSEKLFAGSHCKWCPGMPKCSEITKVNFNADDFDLIDMSADEITERLPTASTKDLSPKTLSDILRKLPALEEWTKGMWTYAEDYVNRGGKIPGFKRVRGKGSRVWGKPKEVEKKFGDLCLTEPEIISPAQLEKVLIKTGETKKDAKKLVDKFTVRLDGKIQLVSEADSRPSIEETLIEGFDLLE